jgi:DNA-binding transcriptional ArsR family regulator
MKGMNVANPFEILADPSRRALLDLMLASPRSVGELAFEAGLSQPNTSRHLRKLRDAGLVERTVDGQRRVYAVRGEGFAELARWLTPYALLWQRSLKALETHLEEVRDA